MFTRIRCLVRGGRVTRARKWHARAEQEARIAEQSARRLFLEALSARDGDGRVLLGRAENLDGTWGWIGLEPESLLAIFGLITGATGMGKSRLICALLVQILRRRIPTTIFDMKGELAGIVLDDLAPALVAAGIDLGPIRVVRPFGRADVPMLRLTAPEPGTSREIQSLNLAAALAEAVGSDLGSRMQRVFLRAASLCVEKNLPLPVIAHWIANPAAFAAEARTSEDRLVRHYALREFPNENRASIDALKARLDELLHLREVRLALSAPDCLSFPECLESGLTVFDFGSAPAGAEVAMRFFAGPVMGRMSRAILSRPVSSTTPPALVVFEEFQESLARHQVEQFKRLLALARFKRTPLWFSNQQPAQIAAVDPHLLRILRTNTGFEAIFRSSIEDAARLAQHLSVRRSDESLAAARARLTEEIATLPKRDYFLWLKDQPFGPQRLRSPRFDLEDMARRSASLPSETRQAIQRGCVSVPVEAVQEVEVEHEASPLTRPLPKRRKTPGLG